MKNIILSIHPRHYEAIVRGEKKFEYRRRMPVQPIRRILFYVSDPVRMVKGYSDIGGILTDTVDGLWDRTGHASGLSHREYREYFNGLDIASAFILDSSMGFTRPRPLSYYDIKAPPQSFQYVICGMRYNGPLHNHIKP